MMKKIFILIIVILCFSVLVLLCLKKDITQIKLPNNETIKVWLVENQKDQQQGLSNVKLEKLQNEIKGMLFVQDQPRQVSFWMKEMFFNLDIFYIGSDKRIKEVYENLKPCLSIENCLQIKSVDLISYVLEVPAGSFNLKVGDKLEFHLD